MLDLIIEPMQYGFMQRALLVSALAATACGVVGTFVVLRGMAFLGDAIAHSALTGMAVAFLFGANIFLGALVWAVPASLGISLVSRRAGVRLDAVIGVLFAGGFALGIILMNMSDNYSGDLLSILFGNVLGASWNDVLAVGLLAGGVVLVVRLLYKELVFTTYDSAVAQASGVPVRFLEYLLPLLVALTTVAALKTVGNVMVMSLLVVPAVTGSLLARRLAGMMFATVVVALAAIVIGLYLSFHLNLPTGPAIVVVSVALLLITVAASPRRWALFSLLRRREPQPEPLAAGD
ncbi:MAG: metal ABC transporter permease [Chloroflexota bacterium]|nr:metal ABC transporter permease [Chloroflexota bacterium]MDE2685536.1 metal ABC transporter permease [Chloroflexota bacterium]